MRRRINNCVRTRASANVTSSRSCFLCNGAPPHMQTRLADIMFIGPLAAQLGCTLVDLAGTSGPGGLEPETCEQHLPCAAPSGFLRLHGRAQRHSEYFCVNCGRCRGCDKIHARTSNFQRVKMCVQIQTTQTRWRRAPPHTHRDAASRARTGSYQHPVHIIAAAHATKTRA